MTLIEHEATGLYKTLNWGGYYLGEFDRKYKGRRTRLKRKLGLTYAQATLMGGLHEIVEGEGGGRMWIVDFGSHFQAQ